MTFTRKGAKLPVIGETKDTLTMNKEDLKKFTKDLLSEQKEEIRREVEIWADNNLLDINCGGFGEHTPECEKIMRLKKRLLALPTLTVEK